MKHTNDITRILYQEFPEVLPNALWKNNDGTYSVFGKYIIVPESLQYRVFCSASDMGTFTTTRSALSWCIADKYQAYNLARELKEVDEKLRVLSNDISARASLADHSRCWEFREAVGTKLETKIIRKKQLENQLAKCVNWAKYCQQQGFANETQRTGRVQPNKSSRQGI